jgi:hypothetical protein
MDCFDSTRPKPCRQNLQILAISMAIGLVCIFYIVPYLTKLVPTN